MINGYEVNGAEINGSAGAGLEEIAAIADLIIPTPNIAATMRLDDEEPIVEITASANLTIPAPTINGFLRFSSATGANLTIPTPTITALSGARAVLPLPVPLIAAEASADIWAKVSLSIPLPALSASGHMEPTAKANLAIGTPTISALGGAQVSMTLPRPAVSASGMTDILARGNIVLPLPTVEASAYQDAVARAELTIPVPVSLHGVTQIVGPLPTIQAFATVEEMVELIAYAMNLRNGAMTHYGNYPFRFIVRFQGRNYAFNDSGAYLLEGDDDDGAKIDAHVRLPPTDFGASQEKRGPYVYIGSGDRQQLLVTGEIDERKTVSAATSMAGRNKRAKLPRGAKGRFWAHTIRNVAGGPLDIDSIEILPEVGRRKV